MGDCHTGCLMEGCKTAWIGIINHDIRPTGKKRTNRAPPHRARPENCHTSIGTVLCLHGQGGSKSPARAHAVISNGSCFDIHQGTGLVIGEEQSPCPPLHCLTDPSHIRLFRDKSICPQKCHDFPYRFRKTFNDAKTRGYGNNADFLLPDALLQSTGSPACSLRRNVCQPAAQFLQKFLVVIRKSWYNAIDIRLRKTCHILSPPVSAMLSRMLCMTW